MALSTMMQETNEEVFMSRRRQINLENNFITVGNDGGITTSRSHGVTFVLVILLINITASLWLATQMPKRNEVVSRSEIMQVNTSIDALKADLLSINNEVLRLQASLIMTSDEMQKRDEVIAGFIMQLHRHDGGWEDDLTERVFKGVATKP